MKKIHPYLIAVAALCLAGCEPAPAPVKVTAKTPEGSFVEQMQQKAQGDPSKLTAEEMQKLNAITRGNAQIVLKTWKK